MSFFPSENPAKLFTPAATSSNFLGQLLRHPFLVGVVFFFSLFLCTSRNPIAFTNLDPAGRILSQDEALYAHTALRMHTSGEYATPHFLGRLLLVKPPLLQWLGVASMRVFGPSLQALRAPSALAAALVLTLVYVFAGPVGFALLATRHHWVDRAGLFLMDDLLTLFYCLAVLCLQRDPRLERRWSAVGFGAAVGLAVLTKWFAGFLPVLLLLWARPTWRKVFAAAGVAAIIAMPWHVYQLIVNREWFLAEYLGVELLTFAFDAPVQATPGSVWSFYLPRAWYLLPLVAPLTLGLFHKHRWSTLWLAWCGVLVASILAYSYRNPVYLAPLAPALLLAHRGWIHWAFLPLCLLGAFGGDLAPEQPEPISRRFAGREVIHVDVDDQLRTTLSPGATVRYAFLAEHLPPNGTLDFEQRGIARRVDDFMRNPGPEVDVVLAKDIEELRRLVWQSPTRDFVMPYRTFVALGEVPPHEVIDGRRVWLKSRQPRPGPRAFEFPLLQ